VLSKTEKRFVNNNYFSIQTVKKRHNTTIVTLFFIKHKTAASTSTNRTLRDKSASKINRSRN
jgi:hypothetical protein